MKIFVVTELGYEYDDCYFQRGDGVGSPVKSYRLKENAEKERDRLNKERLDKGGYSADPDRDYDDPSVIEHEGDLVFKDYYKVVELEVADDEVLDYNQAKSNVRKAIDGAKEAAKRLFAEASAVLFKEYPIIESFGWTQFTAYFNDGDECRFSARTDYFDINGNSIDDLSYEDGRTWNSKTRKYEVTGNPDELGVAINAIRDFLGEFDDEDLRQMFGDHVKITVDRNGVSVDEYTDHH